MSIGRPVPTRTAPIGRTGSARPALAHHDPRHDPRHAGAARAEVPVERPPWARDAGRINGERIPLPRALPGERLARLPQE